MVITRDKVDPTQTIPLFLLEIPNPTTPGCRQYSVHHALLNNNHYACNTLEQITSKQGNKAVK